MPTEFSHQMHGSYITIQSKRLEVQVSCDKGHIRVEAQSLESRKHVNDADLAHALEGLADSIPKFEKPLKHLHVLDVSAGEANHAHPAAVIAVSMLDLMSASALAAMNHLADVQKTDGNGSPVPLLDGPFEIHVSTPDSQAERDELKKIMTEQLQFAHDNGHITGERKMQLSQLLNLPPQALADPVKSGAIVAITPTRRVDKAV